MSLLLTALLHSKMLTMEIKRIVKKVLFAVAFVSALVSCSEQEEFVIEGNIKGAKDKMLYLARVDMSGSSDVDSVKLGANGNFRFTGPRPECFDFYRLQLDKKGRKITIAIDSCETVTVNTTAGHFADSCRIDGSEESVKIAQIAVLEQALQKQVDHLIKNTTPAVEDTRRAIKLLVDEFKQNICKEYIAVGPGKASAYYALFLRLNNAPIFDPMHVRFDSRCFSAVATNLNMTHPHAARSQHLYNLAAKAMRSTQPVSRDTIYVEPGNSSNIGLFDVKLPDIDGDSISLSSLKGKVVMLDFTAYSNAQVSARNLVLREMYDKYKERGFEIYQISYDADEHFWKTSAENLPWKCVRDASGVNSYNLTLYRIDRIPTYFLINRANEVVLRDVQVEDLNKSIEKLLKEK